MKQHKILYLFVFLWSALPLFSKKNSPIDSLKLVLSKGPDDSAKVKSLVALALSYKVVNPDSGIYYYEAALRLSRKIETKNLELSVLNELAVAYREQGQLQRAIDSLKAGVALAKAAKNIFFQATAQRNLSIVYLRTGDNYNAMKSGLEALKGFENINERLSIASSLQQLAAVYTAIANGDKAIELLGQALAVALENGGNEPSVAAKITSARILMSLGNAYGLKYKHGKQQVDADKTLEYYHRTLKMYESANNKIGIVYCLTNISDILEVTGKPDEALRYNKRAMALVEETGDRFIKCGILYNMGENYLSLHDLPNALSCLTKSMEQAQQLRDKPLIEAGYFKLSELYEKQHKSKEAYTYYKLYRAIGDSLEQAENAEKLEELNSRYESQKRENEVKLLLKNRLIRDKEIVKQKDIRNITLAAGAVALIMTLLLFWRLSMIRKLNKQLDAQNDMIIKKNIQITDSISYAERIQQSILPSTEYLKKYLLDAFVLYMPKDIVSGDFYWFREKNDQLLIAAIDCSGHGVPGAMMSMVAYDLLHQATRLKNLEEPAEILKSINEGIQSFSVAQNENNKMIDGMDIALCRIDLDTLELSFSGAQNSIYIIRDKKLMELKADKISIGWPDYFDFEFKTEKFLLKHGDRVYLFSDGFVDQRGEGTHKKYYYEPFKKLLLENSHLPLIEQKRNLQQSFMEWKGSGQQMDDILIMGLSI